MMGSMKASPATATRRTSGSISPGGRSVLLLVMLGLILLSMGWKAAHRYGCCPDYTTQTMPLPEKPLPSPFQPER